MKVWFVSSEMAPLASTGGLGEVIGALPKWLAKLGLDVFVIIPYYWSVESLNLEITPVMKDLWAPLGYKWLNFDVFKLAYENNVTVFLIKREDLYFRPNLYRDSKGDYYDNLERFSFFCNACVRFLNNVAEKKDIIHTHDWHTGLLCALIRSGQLQDGVDTRLVFTIHNIAYQGIYPGDQFYLTGLDAKRFFTVEGMEFWGNINFLKAGVVYSDSITTVSPAHAQELMDPVVARGLEGLFRKRAKDIVGILNGVDYETWDPKRDKYIRANFDKYDTRGKALCKEDVIEEFGLPIRNKGPLIAMVTRLDAQKGIDLVLDAMDRIMEMDLTFLVLGNGDQRFVEGLALYQKKYPERLGVRIAYDHRLAHKVLAGADMVLIPSLFEPCGVVQMYALRYGTIPIARATGGLKDTISQFDPRTGEGNGILFETYDVNGLLWALGEAISYFESKEIWAKMMFNAMNCDFSWERSAKQYLNLYETLWKGR